MSVADNIIAQRQFNEIIMKFNNPLIESITVYHDNVNEECLRMLTKEGFSVSEGQYGSHYVSLPKRGGFYADKY